MFIFPVTFFLICGMNKVAFELLFVSAVDPGDEHVHCRSMLIYGNFTFRFIT